MRDGIVVQHELASEELRVAIGPPTRVSGDSWAATDKPTTAPPSGGAGLPARTLPGKVHARAPASCRICAGESPRISTAMPTSYDGVVDRSRLGDAAPARACRRGAGDSVGRGRLLRRAGRARRTPGRRAGSRIVLRRQPVLAHHPVPSRRRRERHRRLRRRRSRTEAASARSRGRPPVSSGSLVEDVRAELAAIAPRRRCDRLAELSALFHTAGAVHLRGRGAIDLHLDLGSSAAARRAFALLAELRIPSEIRTYAAHSFDRATRYQLHVEGSEPTLATLAEAGVLDERSSPARATSGPRRRAIVLPRRLPPRRVPRRRLADGPAVAPPGGADTDARRRIVPPQRLLVGGGAAQGRGASITCSCLREGVGGDRGLPPRCRSRRRRPRARGAQRRRRDARRGEPTDECRSREPRPHGPRGATTTRRGSAPPGGGRARSARRSRFARQPSSVFAIRRCHSASSPARTSPPATKAAMQRRLARLVELAER